MDLDLRKVARVGIERDDVLLFSESQSRFVVTVAPDKKDVFEKRMQGTACTRVGFVSTIPKLSLLGLSGQKVMDADITALKKSWQQPLAF